MDSDQPLKHARERLKKPSGRPRKATRTGIVRAQVPKESHVQGGSESSATVVKAVALPPRLLDTKGAAIYLGGLSPWTVRDLRESGRLKPVRLDVGGRPIRRLLFDREDLDRLIEEGKV